MGDGESLLATDVGVSGLLVWPQRLLTTSSLVSGDLAQGEDGDALSTPSETFPLLNTSDET